MSDRAQPVSMAPLSGLKVVELADTPAGEYTGRLLAELGCNVCKLEPAGGAPSRGIGPFLKGQKTLESSLNFWFYNAGKKSVIADVDQPMHDKAFCALLGDADILLSTQQPAGLKRVGLNYDELQRKYPKLIIVSVTPFGLTGPWADYLSSDLIALAAGGPLHVTGYDDHSIPPIRPGGNQGYHTAASFAHSGVMMALLQRQLDGHGQIVDVSMHEALAVTIEMAFPYWAYVHAPVYRQTCRHAQPSPTQPAIFMCADGRYVYYVLIVAEQKPWQALVGWLDENGMAADLTEPAYADMQYRQENFHHIQGVVECFFLVKDSREVFHEGQAKGLPIGVLYAPEDLPKDEHFASRGYFTNVAHEGVGNVQYPGSPYRFSGFPTNPPQAAPKLGSGTSPLKVGEIDQSARFETGASTVNSR